MIKLTLGTDSTARKRAQLLAAFLRYIPAAAARFALHSLAGNEKHNPGEPVHHARGKSGDHEECVLRHLVDIQDIRAYMERNGETPEAVRMLLDEATAEFWRAGVFLQELCERYEGAPLAPAARLPDRAEINTQGDPDMRKPVPRIITSFVSGFPFAIVDGNERVIGRHADYTTAAQALDVVLGFKPINTPAESAELAKAQGTVKLVAVPEGTVESFPLIDDEVFERPSAWPERRNDESLERCAHMSDTKRVCVLPAGHMQWHSDGIMNWFPSEG